MCVSNISKHARESRHIPLGLRLGRSLIEMVRLGSIPPDQIKLRCLRIANDISLGDLLPLPPTLDLQPSGLAPALNPSLPALLRLQDVTIVLSRVPASMSLASLKDEVFM